METTAGREFASNFFFPENLSITFILNFIIVLLKKPFIFLVDKNMSKIKDIFLSTTEKSLIFLSVSF